MSADTAVDRDHWLCPGCGTFDGPISYRRCDACEDRPEVRAMGYASAADRLQAENEALREEAQQLRDAIANAAAALRMAEVPS